MMDVSPYPGPSFGRSPRSAPSHTATPSSHKRMREDDAISYLHTEPPPKQQEPMSPKSASGANAGNGEGSCSSAMCVTPMAGFAADSATQALEVGVRWAVHQRQGPRSSQEDTACARMDETYFLHGYFAVYDGHGGSECSEYAACNLHSNVIASEHMPDLVPALKDGFLRTDAELLRQFSAVGGRRKGCDSGTAAVAMVVTADHLTVAHAGDCRALLIKRSSSVRAPSCSHAPSCLALRRSCHLGLTLCLHAPVPCPHSPCPSLSSPPITRPTTRRLLTATASRCDLTRSAESRQQAREWTRAATCACMITRCR